MPITMPTKNTALSPYTLLHQSSECPARCGRVTTLHGTFDTPIFMPVGTLGTVKAVTPENLNEPRSQTLLHPDMVD